MIAVGWLPDLLASTDRPAPWTGQFAFKAFAETWTDRNSWFAPDSLNLTIDVGIEAVEVRCTTGVCAVIARDQLRVWFAHGTADLNAGDITWRGRPMGVSLAIAGWGISPIPADVASHLASAL